MRTIRLLALVALLSLTAPACNGGDRDTLPTVAEIARKIDKGLDAAAVSARDVVVRLRAEAIQTAIDRSAATYAGLPKPDRDAEIAKAATEAAAAFDGSPIDVAATLTIRSINAFQAAMDAKDWSNARTWLVAALDAYDALRAALGDDGDKLPKVPAIVADLLKED